MSMYSHFDCNINYCTVPGLWPSQSDLMCLHKVSDPYGIHLYLVEYQKIHCSAELNYCNIFGSWPSSWPGESARCSQSFPHHPFGWRVKMQVRTNSRLWFNIIEPTKDGDIWGFKGQEPPKAVALTGNFCNNSLELNRQNIMSFFSSRGVGFEQWSMGVSSNERWRYPWISYISAWMAQSRSTEIWPIKLGIWLSRKLVLFPLLVHFGGFPSPP